MDLTKPWRDYTYVAFDTETSGKYPLVDEVVEIAAVKWRDGKIIDTFQTLLKPSRLMGEAVIRIHHITNEMVENAPLIHTMLPAFEKFIEDCVVIAHHTAFDMGFLSYDFEKAALALPLSIGLDSCALGRKAYPESPNHKLATLCTLLKFDQTQAHRALDDSKACLHVGLQCMEKLGATATLEQIIAIQGAPFEWTRYSINALRAHEVFKTVVDATVQQAVLEMVYTGGSAPGQPRRVTPRGLVRNPDGDFMVGLCHKENFEKRYYFNRIVSAKILD